jgi:hypothetical protein
MKKPTVTSTPRKKNAKASQTKASQTKAKASPTKDPLAKAMQAMTSQTKAKAPPKAAAGAPLHAPADWDQETSLRHWFPDAATRAELTALGKEAARAKTEAQKKKAWAQVAALFPPALARLIGRSPWRWGTIPSPEVAAEAMRLITAAPAGTAGEIKAIEGELERILPELPALCLPDVVGNDAYTRAGKAIDAALRAEGDSDVAEALERLRDYLFTT